MSTIIKQFREANDWSYQAVADAVLEKTGIRTSRQQMEKLEKGQRRLTADWMRCLAAAFDKDPAEFMKQPPPTQHVEMAQAPVRSAIQSSSVESQDLFEMARRKGVPESFLDHIRAFLESASEGDESADLALSWLKRLEWLVEARIVDSKSRPTSTSGP
jgi:transcriptional regulator with XRE-family HTH domain